jgi:hypothetical protein
VIFLDADVLLLELRYRRDPRAALNRQALDQIKADGTPLCITTQTLLEVVGILSFGTPHALVSQWPATIMAYFNTRVLPDLTMHPEYAGCTVAELITQMSQQMALGDAVQAVQIARHARSATCLLTWNARHFVGKIPVLTPEEWLNRQQGKTP